LAAAPKKLVHGFLQICLGLFLEPVSRPTMRLVKDGGEIIVVANDPNDKSSIDEIRTHLSQIAIMFSNGNFSAPIADS